MKRTCLIGEIHRHDQHLRVAAIVWLSLLMCAAVPRANSQCVATELGKFVSSGGGANANLGWGIAICGNTAAVGETVSDGIGAVYVFERSAHNVADWHEVKRLVPADSQNGIYFGASVATNGDTIAVAAHRYDDWAGAVYIFERNCGGPGNWGQAAKLIASDHASHHYFGWSMAMDGDRIIIGAGLADTPNGTDSGAAYVFEKGAKWVDGSSSQIAKLSASDGQPGDRFGQQVGISGSTILVTAPNGDNAAASAQTGAAYVFEEGAGWANGSGNQAAKLLACDGRAGDTFGIGAALLGDTILIGAHRAASPVGSNAGAGYVFERDSGWTDGCVNQVAKLTRSNATQDDLFGWYPQGLGEDVIVMSAHYNDDNGSQSGRAYAYLRPAAGWSDMTESAMLEPSSPNNGALFGLQTAVDGDTAVIGASHDPQNGDRAGAFFVFGGLSDCNGNGVLDICDTGEGAWSDANENGIPDHCENQRPTASAGPDQTVDEGNPVVLDGAASTDSDGAPLAYAWLQIAGPTVSLIGADTPNPTFTSPLVSAGGATLTFQLIVNDGQTDSEPDTVNVIVKNVNHPPIADAGADQAVAEASPVTLDGSGSFDPDDDELGYAWTLGTATSVLLSGANTPNPTFTAPTVGHAGATLTFHLSVSDGLEQHSDTVHVVVEDINHVPVADAGSDQTRDEGALATLNGSASSDPDADPLAYLWEQVGGPPVALSDTAAVSPTFTAPSVVAMASVTLTFRLTVDDGYGGVASDEVTITVLDTNAPPACELAQPSVSTLWPPNHKLVPVTILGVADPDDEDVAITITAVTQDEPVDGLGDGDTAPDAVIQGDTVLIRAERAGGGNGSAGGNGRVYVIHFQADDGVGGVCSGTVRVSVPHSKKAACVEDALGFNSTGP